MSNDLRDILKRIPGLKPLSRIPRPERPSGPPPGMLDYPIVLEGDPGEVHEIIQGEVVASDAGEYFKTATEWSFGDWVGEQVISEPRASSVATLSLLGGNGVELRDAVFLDTETTGLTSGTGTYAFMVGLGMFTKSGFKVEQHFMRDLHEEYPLLKAIEKPLVACPAFVSYNGKAFDFPILKTRFVLNRIEADLDSRPHIDMLFAARRLWKRSIQDCNLSNVESKILGLSRDHDIPGALIPQTYFDYLLNRDARPLRSVFIHNKFDILSLAMLTVRAAELVSACGVGYVHDPEDWLSLARIFAREKQFQQVANCCKAALALPMNQMLVYEARLTLSFSLKRLGLWDEAEAIWREESGQAKVLPSYAMEELAKYYEHKAKDLSLAQEICLQAMELLQSGVLGRLLTSEAIRTGTQGSSPKSYHRLADWERRLARIKRKIERNHVVEEGSQEVS